MFKKLKIKVFLVIFCFINLQMAFSSDIFCIPHIAENTWDTSITVYNLGDSTEHFTLLHYEGGIVNGTYDYDVNPKDSIKLSNEDFGFNGIAQIEAKDSSFIRVKLSYKYLENNSESLCEFFIKKNNRSQNWFLPNPIQSHFQWFGLAIVNDNTMSIPADVYLYAYKNGNKVGSRTISIPFNTKVVGVSNDIWDGLNYSDIDMVEIKSTVKISSPLSITGNYHQDRHVFFSGTEIYHSNGPVYYIPHIPSGNWKTKLTIYNLYDLEKDFTFYQIKSDGNQTEPLTETVQGKNFIELDSQNHFLKEGFGFIQSKSPLIIKLSYRFGNSESICDFILNSSFSNKWVLTNTINNWFDWFGIALPNFCGESINLNFKAYKNGTLIDSNIMTVKKEKKLVDLSDNFWPDSLTTYNDVDMVIVESDIPIASPVSITGNEEQNRHVFFQGTNFQEYISIPDQNFKTYLLNNFDKNNDNEISLSEAEDVTTIDTPGSFNNYGEIKDLEGVQFFKNLKTLRAQWEQIDNVPNLWTLKKLQWLYLDHNPIKKINGLSKMNSLSDLYVEHTEMEKLESLPVNLEKIMCSWSKLTYINLKGLTKLSYFDCNSNEVENIVGCEDLNNIHEFWAGSNKLTNSLDFSHSGLLSVLNLSFNNLKELNVNGCSNLVQLKAEYNELEIINGIADCVNLNSLYLKHNKLLELALTNNNLVLLDVTENQLNSLSLSNLTSLVFLYCSNNKLVNIDFSSLTSLEKLVCHNSELTKIDLTNLANLEYVDVGSNKLNTIKLDGCISLSTLFCTNNMLENIPDITFLDSFYAFYCFDNYFGEDDCELINAINNMNISFFQYNNQKDGTTLTCE